MQWKIYWACLDVECIYSSTLHAVNYVHCVLQAAPVHKEDLTHSQTEKIMRARIETTAPCTQNRQQTSSITTHSVTSPTSQVLYTSHFTSTVLLPLIRHAYCTTAPNTSQVLYYCP
jgi:hypothetical protein